MCFLYRMEQKEIARTRRVLGLLHVQVESQEGSANPPLGPMLAQFLLDIPTTVTRFNDLSKKFCKGLPVNFKAYVRKKNIFYILKSPSFYFFFSQYFLDFDEEEQRCLRKKKKYYTYLVLSIIDLYNVVLAYQRYTTYSDQGSFFRCIFSILKSYQDKYFLISINESLKKL